MIVALNRRMKLCIGHKLTTTEKLKNVLFHILVLDLLFQTIVSNLFHCLLFFTFLYVSLSLVSTRFMITNLLIFFSRPLIYLFL